MIMVMEELKKYSVTTYDSFKAAVEELGGAYGQLSLHWNAAVAMFLLATDEEREKWVALIEKARRAKGEEPMLHRLKTITGVTATPPVSTPAEPEGDTKLKAAADKGLRGSPPGNRRAS